MLRKSFRILYCASKANPSDSSSKIFRAVRNALKESCSYDRNRNAITPDQIQEINRYLTQGRVLARGVSQAAWCLSKLMITDHQIWGKVILHLPEAFLTPGDAAITIFSLSRALQNEPSLLSEESKKALEVCVETHVNSSACFSEACSLCDCSQISFGLTSIFPLKPRMSLPFLRRATKLLQELPKSEGTEEVPLLGSCRDVCLLWSVARERKAKGIKVGQSFIEALCEASRGLRNCSDFNQNKAAQVSESIASLNVGDPRVVFQVILFVDTHRSEINGRNLLRIMRSMHALGVDNPVLWRRIANRLEDAVGLGFDLKELEEIRWIFTKSSPRNPRVQGILGLYIKTKQEFIQYDGLTIKRS